jgi:glycosyltransferase-like protein LARGE
VNSRAVNDPVVKSKIFSGSMGPSDINLFYYKAEEEFEQDDISITTIVTSDRFPVLSRLATQYKGIY